MLLLFVVSGDDLDNALHDANQDARQQFLEDYPLNICDAVRLALELLETASFTKRLSRDAALKHCRMIIQTGATAYENQLSSLSFESVVEEMMSSKQHLRKRTLVEMRQYCNRIAREDACWRLSPLSNITARDCHEAIYNHFLSPSTQRKAMTILRSVFNFGIRRGFCLRNPIDSVDTPRVAEKHIAPLTLPQVKTLLKLLSCPEHSCCAAAVGIMLWAGIRPTEITRLRWNHIHFSDRMIELTPRHTKTGGARLVTMHPVLMKWLRRTGESSFKEGRIIPSSWSRRWRYLRQCAGLTDWQADILRHTYASYHLRHFKNLSALQLEMGHSNPDLLRTRYLSLGNITEQAAAAFWGEARQVAGSR